MRWHTLIGTALALTVGAGLLSSAARAADGTAATEPAAARELRVAVVQMRSASNLDENAATIGRHLARCASDGARVVVFPECALSGYLDADYIRGLTAEQLAKAEQAVAKACRENNVYAIVGSPWRAEGKLYNSALVIAPTGKVLERYHKVQLAEAWPDAGDHLSVFPIDGVPCSLIICHDERYPELVRLPVLAGARVIFCVSHESGVKQERKIGPYRAQLQARAVENTVFVVQGNAPANDDTTGSHGQSRIIAPDGNLVQEASIFGEDVLHATLDMSQATGKTARLSVERGPLGDWWQLGVKRVRIISE